MFFRPNAPSTTAQTAFSIIHSQNVTLFLSFSTLFHFSYSKFTTICTIPGLYNCCLNCKLHFTTAQIVISCTLKYALLSIAIHDLDPPLYAHVSLSTLLFIFIYLY